MNHFGQLIEQLLSEVSGKSVAHLGGKEFVHPALNPSGRASSGLRKGLEHGFKIIKGNYKSELHQLVYLYMSGRLPLNKTKREAQAIITKFYGKAFVYGMKWQAAGRRTPKTFELSAEQRKWVTLASNDEFGFFSQLLDDIRYKRVFKSDRQDWEDRVVAYTHTLDSVRDAGRVAATPDDMIYFWYMDREAEHCDGCAYLEEQSPFTKHNLPCTPRDGSTRCLSFCKCRLIAKRVTPKEYAAVAGTILPKSRLVTHLRALFAKRKMRRS